MRLQFNLQIQISLNPCIVTITSERNWFSNERKFLVRIVFPSQLWFLMVFPTLFSLSSSYPNISLTGYWQLLPQASRSNCHRSKICVPVPPPALEVFRSSFKCSGLSRMPMNASDDSHDKSVFTCHTSHFVKEDKLRLKPMAYFSWGPVSLVPGGKIEVLWFSYKVSNEIQLQGSTLVVYLLLPHVVVCWHSRPKNLPFFGVFKITV